jgi:acetyl-CoA carboxylase carboxyl transferase subunit alpha
MAAYLDFEQDIQKIEAELKSAKSIGDKDAVTILNEQLEARIEKVYSNLTDYQKLQLARHKDRPHALDYIKEFMTNAHEIHGDRKYKDDPAIVCYLGYIGKQKAVVIGEQKGRETAEKLERNFGMPHPEGYRKALRAARIAEKFNIPILMLVDTAGAYPGIEAEERGQSEAIARNLLELSDLNTTIISIVIGEGGSGGALAISVADRLAMMRYSVLSVISPEGCAAILWDDSQKAQHATGVLKITPDDLLNFKLIDDILDEPIIGAHRDRLGAANAIKKYFLKSVNDIKSLSSEQRYEERYKKLRSLGMFQETNNNKE